MEIREIQSSYFCFVIEATTPISDDLKRLINQVEGLDFEYAQFSQYKFCANYDRYGYFGIVKRSFENLLKDPPNRQTDDTPPTKTFNK